MKRLFAYLPVILGVLLVTSAVLATSGMMISPPGPDAETTPPVTWTSAENQDEPLPPAESTASRPSVTSSVSPRSTEPPAASQETSAGAETSTTASTTTTTTTTTSTSPTKKQEPQASSGGRYSSMRVFLDKQRIVFYRVNKETGKEYPAYAVKCSTGTSRYPTPTTGPNSPIIMGGRKARLTIFNSTKSTIPCWVRYATHLRGSIWFHSVPYDLLKDSNGKAVFDPTRCYMWSGYDVLGSRTSSHGCIRLALRDAMYLYNNTYAGMPCYVLSSSSGYELPAPQPLPPALKGPRNWDPTDPDWPGYKAEPTATTTVPETTTTTTEATTAPPTTTASSSSSSVTAATTKTTPEPTTPKPTTPKPTTPTTTEAPTTTEEPTTEAPITTEEPTTEETTTLEASDSGD